MPRWSWTFDDLLKAVHQAEAGRGRQLAKLIKATSEADLAAGLSRHNGDLGLALAHCAGRREMRAKSTRWRREIAVARRRQGQPGRGGQ